MGGTPRHRPAWGLLATLLAVLIAAAPSAAAARTPHSRYHPRAAHIGVVVTTGEVLDELAPATTASGGKVAIRRGEGACPRTPDRRPGRRRDHAAARHRPQREAGRPYCYTRLLASRAGDVVTTSARTGLVTCPDASVVPPAHRAARPRPRRR